MAEFAFSKTFDSDCRQLKNSMCKTNMIICSLYVIPLHIEVNGCSI